MEFEITNTSSNYKGRVEVLDKTEGTDPDSLVDIHILKPSESAKITVWDTRYLVLKEVKEKSEPPYSNKGAEDTGQTA